MPTPEIKPRDVMPEHARTLPARYYVDRECFDREMDRLFARMWVCAGRAEQVGNPGDFFVRELLGEKIIITRGPGSHQRLLQRLPASRHAALHGDARHLPRQHPVSVSRLDLRPRRMPDWRAAHGRSAALPQGRLPAASGRRRGLGRARLHQSRSRRPRRSRRSSAHFPPGSARGAWRISGSATASSTTCARTGS